MASFAYDEDDDADDDSSYKEGSIDIDDILDSDKEKQTPAVIARRARKYTSFSTSLENHSNLSRLHKRKKATTKKKRRPKPPDHPRRPLSAYNIFFQEQRSLIIGPPAGETIISENGFNDLNPPSSDSHPSFERKKRAHRRTHGKISFSDLAKRIGQMWNTLDANDRHRYEVGAAKEKARYKEELQLYQAKKKTKGQNSIGQSHDSDSEMNITVQSSLPVKGYKRSPVSTITTLDTHNRSSIPINPTRNVILLSSFSHSFLEDDCWSLSNNSTNIHRYQMHPSRISDSYEMNHRNQEHSCPEHILPDYYKSKSRYNTTLGYEEEEKTPYRVKPRDNNYEVLPLNYKSTMNVHEMVDFIRPLLAETSDKRNTASVFRPVVRSHYDNYHDNAKEGHNDDESFPYLAKNKTKEDWTVEMNHIKITSNDTASSSFSVHPSTSYPMIRAPSFPPNCIRNNNKNKMAPRPPRITDYEVVDFLSCLLSHDQDDSQQQYDVQPEKKKRGSKEMSSNAKQSYTIKKNQNYSTFNYPAFLPLQADKNEEDEVYSSNYPYHINSLSFPPTKTATNTTSVGYHPSQQQLEQEDGSVSYSFSSTTNQDNMFAI